MVGVNVLWAKRIGAACLALFILLNLFLYTSSRWNPDGIPGFGNWRVLSVLTGSMAPEIRAGDMVIVVRYTEEVPREGDIVTYWKDDQSRSLITHRVVKRLENGYLQTQGDANEGADGGWTDPDRLVGQVVFTIPYAAVLQQLIKQPLTLVLLCAGFLASLVYAQRRQSRDPATRQNARHTETMEGKLS